MTEAVQNRWRRNHKECTDAASCWGRRLPCRALARPAIAGKSQTLTIVPQVALNSIDPVWTSSQIARNMGFMVFDLLYGRDEAMNPRPQMLEGDLMEDDGRRWTLRLRENLWFHDGEPVRSRDCIASLQALDGARPGRRDAVAAARCDGGAG